jgi:hypothetical protein
MLAQKAGLALCGNTIAITCFFSFGNDNVTT